MPKKSSSNSKATSSSSGSASAPKSNYQYYIAYGGWYGFMHSHGLKPYDLDDVEWGKAIVEGYRQDDAEEAANARKKKSG